eukprot:scaffold17545_cov94-Isochrysis_galbana.AAC.2
MPPPLADIRALPLYPLRLRAPDRSPTSPPATSPYLASSAARALPVLFISPSGSTGMANAHPTGRSPVLRGGRQWLLRAAGASLPRRPAAIRPPVHGFVGWRRGCRDPVYKCAKGGTAIGGASGAGGGGHVGLSDEGRVEGGGDGGEGGGVLGVTNVPEQGWNGWGWWWGGGMGAGRGGSKSGEVAGRSSAGLGRGWLSVGARGIPATKRPRLTPPRTPH